MDFQKLLFLSQQDAEQPHFDFVPYSYGCYSFQAQADIEVLESRGWLRIENNDINLTVEPSGMADKEEMDEASVFIKKYSGYRGIELVRYVYEHYPYYAMNSKMAKSILTSRSYEAVLHAHRETQSDTTCLFTIGYEGLSIEKYINTLIRNDVRLLCDVRRNPLSRKFGFSKGSLSRLLPKLGIKYVHLPELGIASEHRNRLTTKEDYARLFGEYRKNLGRQQRHIDELYGMLGGSKRVALTCFERAHDFCHRHCISEFMEDLFGLKAVHL